MPEITMPRLSDTMQEGTVSHWLKQVGDTIERGDVIAQIESDKATMELVAYESGVLEQILVQEGETVPIGRPVALLGSAPGTAAPGQSSASPEAEAMPESRRAHHDVEVAAPGSSVAAVVATQPPRVAGSRDGEPEKVKASPLARAVAREFGVDLRGLRGSGEAGRIIRADVEEAREAGGGNATLRAPAAISAPTTLPASPTTEQPANGIAPAEVEEIPLNNVRRVAARRLTESVQQVPHFFLTRSAQVDSLLALRGDINRSLEAAGEDLKVSVNDLLVAACAVALRENPAVNVSWAGDRILRHLRVNIGIAVATDNGLMVPVIPDADRKSVSEIAGEARRLIERARAGRLTAQEFTGGTFTISNLGMYGIEHFTAVINPPEAALLAVGAARAQPVAAGDGVVIRQVMDLTLAIDHRPLDGATGAQFLQKLVAILENPLRTVI